MPTDTATTAPDLPDIQTLQQLLSNPDVSHWVASPLDLLTIDAATATAPDFSGAQTARWVLDTLTRELTISFDTFEDLATDHGRIDEIGNLYRPTLRAQLDPRYAILADAYDAYQAARGSFKRAFRG